MAIFIIWFIFIFAISCFAIAEKKGRNPYRWAIYGIIGGIFTIIILLILPYENHSKKLSENHSKNHSSVNIFSLVFGIILCVLGLAVSFTGIGAIIGVPSIGYGIGRIGNGLLKKV